LLSQLNICMEMLITRGKSSSITVAKSTNNGGLKMMKKMWKNRSGVSPVIATILMVAMRSCM